MIVLHRHVYDRLMTQYLPISGALTTFIAALDLPPVEHTLPAVRICASAARPNGAAVVGLAGKAVPDERTVRGHGQYPD
jgi:hypothetical protein